MALFKILKGAEANLPTTYTEGYAYFTVDEGNLYIDISNTERVQVNAGSAEFAAAAAVLNNGEDELEIADIKSAMEGVEGATSKAYNVTLSAANWVKSGNVFTYTLALPALTCGSQGDIPPIICYTSNRDEYSLITEAVADAGTGIVFYSEEKPGNEIGIVIVDVG